jgi:hypothetical protein
VKSGIWTRVGRPEILKICKILFGGIISPGLVEYMRSNWVCIFSYCSRKKGIREFFNHNRITLRTSWVIFTKVGPLPNACLLHLKPKLSSAADFEPAAFHAAFE